MQTTRRNHKITSYLAILLLLWAVIAPTLSHAIGSLSAKGDPWSDICSARPAQQSPGEGAPQDSDSNGMPGHSEHCGYCLLGALNGAPPPAAPIGFTDSLALSWKLPAFEQAVLPHQTWGTPHTRAPPA